jgi:tetratricopeptide (TPR) repeat protein
MWRAAHGTGSMRQSQFIRSVVTGLALAACIAPAAAAEPGVGAMHEFLVAEIAAQRGDTEAALAIYRRLAREHGDAQVARRAVEVAVRARAFGPALEASALLLELEPESALAREIIASLLANEGSPEKAAERIAPILKASRDPGALLTQLAHAFAKFPDKLKVLEATRGLVAPYAGRPESHFAMAAAALVAGSLELAQSECQAAAAARPGWEQAAILQAQVLRKAAPDKVIAHYQDFVARYPQSREVRMQLGRELAGDRKNAEARVQFLEAEKLAPDDANVAYAIGLLSMQLQEWDDAEKALKRALALGFRDESGVYLSLGAVAEGRKNYDEAIGWYRKVDATDWVRAQLKIATVIARQQGLAAGREHLQKIEPRSTEDRIQMIQVEAQLLRDAKAWRDTYDVLSRAVEEHPESFELLYDRAMAAERVDRLDVLEKDLRRVIEMKPDYAHAYNALGYTLADRTNRLDEARALIEKAISMSPDDPFILDSLGWVHYRLGNHAEAIRHLRHAYDLRPDPEIAAHLGEVLWKTGQRDQAQEVWKTALAANPDHEVLLAVIQKFKP